MNVRELHLKLPEGRREKSSGWGERYSWNLWEVAHWLYYASLAQSGCYLYWIPFLLSLEPMSTNTAESGSFSRNFHLGPYPPRCVCVMHLWSGKNVNQSSQIPPTYPGDISSREMTRHCGEWAPRERRAPPIHLQCSLETSSLSSPHILGVPNNKPPMEKEGKEARSKKKREAVAWGGMTAKPEHSQLEVNLFCLS